MQEHKSFCLSLNRGTIVTDQMINEPMTKVDCCVAWHSALHACY